MITLRQLLVGLGARLEQAGPDLALRTITQDSREVRPGDLFIARRGETLDGHSFIADAVNRGAAVVLAERTVDLSRPLQIVDLRSAGRPVEPIAATPGAIVYILTADSQQALERVAAWWRGQLPVDVVGVTGSVGKTSTKEATAAVLGQRFTVLKSERSLNTDVGMALTLLGLTDAHQKAVLEMGMYARREIAHLCRLARPRIGIVTNVGPVHLERLGSIEAIAEAKAELVDALPDDGVAILNADDERVWAMRRRTRAVPVGFGLRRGADVWADDVAGHGLQGISFTLHHGERRMTMRSPLIGEHNVWTCLAATAAGIVCGLSLEQVSAGLQDQSQARRLAIVQAANGAVILDDTYNASPTSVSASLDILAGLQGRRIAVLGDMLELGAFEEEGHRLVGRKVAQRADVLVAVGPRGRFIGQEAAATGMAEAAIHYAAGNTEATAIVRDVSRAGDVILVKGSRGMKMEEIVHALAARQT